MSWLSKKTGIHLNLKPLAPILGAAVGSVIPGVGTALGAGLGRTLSGLGNKESIGHALGQGALAGAAGGLGSKALGAIKAIPGAANLPGVQSIGGVLGKAKDAVKGLPGMDKLGSVVNSVKGAARAANGGKPITLATVGGALKKGAGAALANPELAAAGLSGFAGFRDARRADQLENDSIDTLRNAYLALNPNAPREDTSALFADPGNPYAQAKKIRLAVA